jgi:hypothetical protein
VIDPADKPLLSPANGNGPIYDSYNRFLGGLYAKTHVPITVQLVWSREAPKQSTRPFRIGGTMVRPTVRRILGSNCSIANYETREG